MGNQEKLDEEKDPSRGRRRRLRGRSRTVTDKIETLVKYRMLICLVSTGAEAGIDALVDLGVDADA
eukprot:8108440-Pyramimonas_sp.AAC.1